MPLAYYAQEPDEAYWSNLWQQNQFDYLLQVAARDPLSTYLEAYLDPNDLTLEGGCGLGQYVLHFQQRHYRIIGGDFSFNALQTHRRLYAQSPLLTLDLLKIPLADNSIQAHISIGVVEHLVDGPEPILNEIYRTLKPGGFLLLTVPWLNGYRRLAQGQLQKKYYVQRDLGHPFYQYAYSQQEIEQFLRPIGFEVQEFYPYSPAKGMREVTFLKNLYARFKPNLSSLPKKDQPASQQVKNQITEPLVQESPKDLRRVLYWWPILHTFSHMILAVAQKPKN